MIRTISPTTNQVLVETLETSLDNARQIAQLSKLAFSKWAELPLAHRKELVAKAVVKLHQKKDQLALELTQQMGRPIRSAGVEIDTMKKRADYLLSISENALSDLPGTIEHGFRRWTRKIATGPTLLVFPWNYPYLTLINALVPALLAGNTVILKPSPQTPLVATRIAEAFGEAGFPEGVIQFIQSGNMEILQEIAKLDEIRLINFTGSTAGGVALRKAIAERIVPLNLELGGNDPAYVLEDANIEFAAAELVDGAIFNSGQSCCSVERIYVHEKVHDRFVKAVQEVLRDYKLGSPLDPDVSIGPVVSAAAATAIRAQIDDAISKGATNRTPHNLSFIHPPPEGNYVAPTLLTNVDNTMEIMTKETFGPVIAIQSVASNEEAISLMNNSDYGLTASIWTANIEKGEGMMHRLEAGTVFINRCDCPNPDLAWSGFKNSGLGHTLGPAAFDGFVRLKSYHLKILES